MTRELSLQPRLALLASLVPQGAVLADVGTDHGYIPVCLRQRGVIDRAIASDIGREPLEHAAHRGGIWRRRHRPPSLRGA